MDSGLPLAPVPVGKSGPTPPDPTRVRECPADTAAVDVGDGRGSLGTGSDVTGATDGPGVEGRPREDQSEERRRDRRAGETLSTE